MAIRIDYDDIREIENKMNKLGKQTDDLINDAKKRIPNIPSHVRNQNGIGAELDTIMSRSQAIESVVQPLKDSIKKYREELEDIMNIPKAKGFLGGIKSKIGGAYNSVKGKIGDAVDSVKDKYNSAKDWLSENRKVLAEIFKDTMIIACCVALVVATGGSGAVVLAVVAAGAAIKTTHAAYELSYDLRALNESDPDKKKALMERSAEDFYEAKLGDKLGSGVYMGANITSSVCLMAAGGGAGSGAAEAARNIKGVMTYSELAADTVKDGSPQFSDLGSVAAYHIMTPERSGQLLDFGMGLLGTA